MIVYVSPLEEGHVLSSKAEAGTRKRKLAQRTLRTE